MIGGDHLGAKGEARFSELCKDAQLICNKSNRDLTGWDFIVEFPFAKDEKPTAPLESHKTPLSCALHYFNYSFCRIHKTLRVTPQWPLAALIEFGI